MEPIMFNAEEFNARCSEYSERIREVQAVRDDSVAGLTAELTLAHEVLEFLDEQREGAEGVMLSMLNIEIGRMQFVAGCVTRALHCRRAAEAELASVACGVITVH
jgi:hypothetical protein